MQVQQLIYQSSPTATLTSTQLQQLLPTWRANNQAATISGLLLYGDEGIMQVLEGPAEHVHQTYARILRDRRHYNIYTVADGLVPTRAFTEWSMGFVHLGAPDLDQLAGYVSLARPNQLLPTQAEEWPELLALLQEFVAREQYPAAG
ncbi:BLUF domain-containing protein [Hymenobacter sp. BT559]|uniref:BLUF domain-containing protein n=1 Tax=Hymenobacter sp. BT559 TaxID=2795729 RepID=UPI0018EB8114|nr:BLUF domain-containing protein [Hymenobacter sp. BT559]MBJ6141993.1 BLUF domain-containing protein [Hymenobacter sp. BT559]